MNFLITFMDSAPLFLKGMGLTLLITCLSLLFATPLGLLVMAAGKSQNRLLKAFTRFYIYLVRGTPLIVQIFILYFGLTDIIKLEETIAASLALAFHNGAYLAEIFRGAIDSISKGQFEAAKSLGMSRLLTYRKIILPQAFKRALPSIGNQFIIALKDSSLAAFISMNELFNIATTLGANNFDQMTYLLIVSIYYLILVSFITLMTNLLEKRYFYVE